MVVHLGRVLVMGFALLVPVRVRVRVLSDDRSTSSGAQTGVKRSKSSRDAMMPVPAIAATIKMPPHEITKVRAK